MKNNKKILILIVIILISFVIIEILHLKQKDSQNISKNENTETATENETEIIEQLKNEVGAQGNTEIYEVQTEYDGRKVIGVKANTKYKVALAGMLKNAKPSYNELDEIINNKAPKNAGIWIENKSREKVNNFLNNNSYLNSKYYIDNQGYIKIQEKNNQNEIDIKLENIINGNKQYIVDISSVCYIVDSITGEILDYNFEKMDKYQTYQYFKDDELMILFVNENTDNQLTEKEIFESVINLI